MVVRGRWSFVCWCLALVGLALIVLGTAGPVLARDVRVNMGDNFFEPATLTVNVGDTVTWTHTGNRPHDVTSDNGAINSPRRMATGQTFTYTATTPGTYTYICTIHPVQMKATLIVQAAGAAPAPSMPRSGAGGMADSETPGGSPLVALGLALVVSVVAGTVWRSLMARASGA
jgi:plastocyanin